MRRVVCPRTKECEENKLPMLDARVLLPSLNGSDGTMIRDQVAESAYGNSHLDVEVKCPRTHIENERAVYTDYEIHVQTSHPAFPLPVSRVRRRYSDFTWLKNKLGLDGMYMSAAPRLPGKQLVGRFKESFLTERQQGLQQFLKRLVCINAFAFHPALLLFLQTNLSVNEMNYFLRSRTPAGIKSLVQVKYHQHETKQKEERTRRKLHTGGYTGMSHEYPPVKRKQKQPDYGKDLPFMQEDLSFGKAGTSAVKRERSFSSVAAFHRTRLSTLPTIPGSSDNFASSDSLPEEEEDSHYEHPLSASWHGTTRDEVDLVLEEYDIIPLDAIASVEQADDYDDDDFANDLSYLDLTASGGTHHHEGKFD